MNSGMKKTASFGIALVASALLFAGANNPGSTSTLPADAISVRPIPEIEAERLAAAENLGRDDCGRLSADALERDRAPITTRSRNFVVENVTGTSVALPIAGAQARVAVFSETDGSLEATLADPNGNDVALKPYARADADAHDSMSRVQDGRGAPADGVVLINDYQIAGPGVYTLTLGNATSPVDVIVKDEQGPELQLSLDETSYDTRRAVTLRAKIVEGTRLVEGARLVAKLRGERNRRWHFTETGPGTYEARIKAGALQGMPILQVEAKGTTADGVEFQRNGNIGTIAGEANAVVLDARPGNRDGADLTVDVDVNVTAAGRFHLRANLVAGGAPVAWAQDARDLQPGRHTLTLRFDRRLVEPSGQTLTLTDVTLLNVTTAPGVKATSRAPKQIAL